MLVPEHTRIWLYAVDTGWYQDGLRIRSLVRTHTFSAVAPLLALWWIALSGINDPSVTRYCAYEAVSEAQLHGCNSHVTVDQINALDTNAARYAKATLSECLADSGLAGQTGLFHTSLPRS